MNKIETEELKRSMVSEQDTQALLDLCDGSESDLIELGKRIGPENMNVVLEIFGGMKPHIPNQANFWSSLERRKRDADIRTKFRGNNLDELMEESGLSERRLREILFPTSREKNHNGDATPLKTGKEYHAEVMVMASRYRVTARTMCDALLDIVFKLPQLRKELGERLGDQVDMFEDDEAA